jgi:hypothetical protein
MRRMENRPKNWQLGVTRSLEVRVAKARVNHEQVADLFKHIAFAARPKTYKAYVEVLEHERVPTVSGRGRWSIQLVAKYMGKMGTSPKKLLKETPERGGLVRDYPDSLNAQVRAVLHDVYDLSEKNGTWVAVTQREPLANGSVTHVKYGVGSVLKRLSLVRYTCSFWGFDAEGDYVRTERVCAAADLSTFVFNRSPDEQRRIVEDAARRIYKGSEMALRMPVAGAAP